MIDLRWTGDALEKSTGINHTARRRPPFWGVERLRIQHPQFAICVFLHTYADKIVPSKEPDGLPRIPLTNLSKPVVNHMKCLKNSSLELYTWQDYLSEVEKWRKGVWRQQRKKETIYKQAQSKQFQCCKEQEENPC